MKLTVLIRRQRNDEPQSGILKAYVVQEGIQSKVNLLAHQQLTDVESAKSIVGAKLRQMFPTGGKVSFKVQEDRR